MKTKIALLVINTVILAYWIITGVRRAVYEPTWACMLDGSAITLYILTVAQNIASVVKAVKSKAKNRVCNEVVA